MKNAHDDEKINDTAMENVEVVIDTFAEHFLTGDIQKIVVDLPIINNVTAVVEGRRDTSHIFLEKLLAREILPKRAGWPKKGR